MISTRVHEALESLRNKPPKSTTLERYYLTHQTNSFFRSKKSIRKNQAELEIIDPNHITRLVHSQPLQLGYGLKRILHRISTPIDENDLLVGRITEIIPPLLQDLKFFLTLAKKGLNPGWIIDGGHDTFAWDRLLHRGLKGLQEEAQKLYDIHKLEMKNPEILKKELDFLSGAILIYQAFRDYLGRYGIAAKKNGKNDIAIRCLHLQDLPPATFADALQLIWIVGFVYSTMGSYYCTLTFGRLDQLLYSYYQKDIYSGQLTRDHAAELIEDFYCKMNLILGRGEHQMSSIGKRTTGWHRNLSYDSPLYVIIGGQQQDSTTLNNELTELFLDALNPRFENPVLVVRYTNDISDHIWTRVCDLLRQNASLLIYNDHHIIPGWVHIGIEPKDAVEYTLHGCNWPDIPGIQHSIEFYHINLSKLILDTFLNTPTEKIRDATSFYNVFRANLNQECQSIFQNFRDLLKKFNETAPNQLYIEDCFMEGPLDRIRNTNRGGLKYPTIMGRVSGIGTATDSISAIDDLVWVQNKISYEQLLMAVKANFEGHEKVRQLCLHAPKFGQDEELPDKHAQTLLQIVTEELDQVSKIHTPDQLIITRTMSSDMDHINEGKRLGATPDGRLQGQPLSENHCPSVGASTKGLTSMLNSLAKLPFQYFNSGTLNIKIPKRLVSGTQGLNLLKIILKTYFENGGMQVQLSILDSEELRAAQKDPQKYQDLMVRVTGYSACFVDMNPNAQEEIIRREEMVS